MSNGIQIQKTTEVPQERREVAEGNQQHKKIGNSSLYVSETGSSLGRGVFAGWPFQAGEVIEVTPVVLLALKTQPFPLQIRRLVYNWSKTHVALALGYGSLYNHSDQPNLTFKRDLKNQTIIFSATRKIEAGQQLTISYDYIGSGESPRKRSWFEIHKVEKIDIDNGKNRNKEQL